MTDKLIAWTQRREEESARQAEARISSAELNLGFALETEGAPLERLQAAQDVKWVVEQLTEQLVGQSRREGASWLEIGKALGVSPQGAHSRWKWVEESNREKASS